MIHHQNPDIEHFDLYLNSGLNICSTLWFCLQCALQWTLAYSVPYIKTHLVQYTMIPFASFKNQIRFLKSKTITCSLTPNVLTLAIFCITHTGIKYQLSILYTLTCKVKASADSGAYWVGGTELTRQDLTCNLMCPALTSSFTLSILQKHMSNKEIRKCNRGGFVVFHYLRFEASK